MRELATIDPQVPPRFDPEDFLSTELPQGPVRLWLGASDLWITTPDQAVRRPF